jgi:hypothetical protein
VKRLHRKWARKVRRSQNFVVLTDEESAMNLIGVNPDSFNDLVKLTAQAQALRIFQKKLDKLIIKHEKEVVRFKRKGGHTIVHQTTIPAIKDSTQTPRIKRKR